HCRQYHVVDPAGFHDADAAARRGRRHRRRPNRRYSIVDGRADGVAGDRGGQDLSAGDPAYGRPYQLVPGDTAWVTGRPHTTELWLSVGELLQELVAGEHVPWQRVVRLPAATELAAGFGDRRSAACALNETVYACVSVFRRGLTDVLHNGYRRMLEDELMELAR